MASYEEFRKDLPLFVEAGLIAIKQGDEESAKKLFNGVAAIDKDNSTVSMGFALIDLHKMELTGAEKKFLEAIQKDPNNYQAKAFLSFTYILWAMDEKNSQKQLSFIKNGTELAQEVLKNSNVETTKELAQSVLDWVAQLGQKASTLMER